MTKAMNKDINTSVTICGIYELNIEAYEELNRSIEDFFSTDNRKAVNLYFLPIAVEYLKNKGESKKAKEIKDYIKSLTWIFEVWQETNNYRLLYTFNEEFRVNIFTLDEEGNDIPEKEKSYNREEAYEVLRDICIPVVLAYY